MVPEKLSIFRKIIARIGRRLYRRFAQKIDLVMLHAVVYAVTKKYEEIFDGDTGLAVDTFTEQFVNAIRVIMLDMVSTIKIFFTKSLEDLPFMAELTIYFILGSKWKKFISKPTFIPAEESKEGVAQLIIQNKVCGMCTGLRPGIDIDPKKLKENSYGELFAQAVVTLLQMVQDYVGNSYEVTAKERKCMLRGDPYGEYVIYLHPKEN